MTNYAEGPSYVVFAGSQAAMQQAFNDAPGPGQSQATLTIRLAEIIYWGGSTVDVRRVPGHSGVAMGETIRRTSTREEQSKGRQRLS